MENGPHDLTRRELLSAAAILCASAGSMPAGPEGGSAVPGPRTRVGPHLGVPTFYVDDVPATVPAFETYVPEARYFRQMADAGCRVFSFSANLGAGFRPACWLGPDRWNFSDVDLLARRVLDARADALILPRIFIQTPPWWLETHPDETREVESVRDGNSTRRRTPEFPSIASEVWRRDMAAGLRRLVEHIQTSDYGPRIFGYMLTGMCTEEWYHWGVNSGEAGDYSPAAHGAFRNWLRGRYTDVESLRQAWGDPKVDFDSAAVPSGARRRGNPARTFRDPHDEAAVIDHDLFHSEIIPKTIDHFAAAVKEVTRGRKVVGAFYGYMFEFGGDPQFGHNALGRYVRSPHVDFMMVTSSYARRGLGQGADYLRSPAGSLALHGKLWYHDDDVVSYLFPTVLKRLGLKEGFGPGTIQQYGENLGVTRSLEETSWMYRRNAGFTLGNGLYQSFFDLHGGYYDDPGLLSELARIVRVLGDSAQADRSSVAQIVLVADEASGAYLSFANGAYARSLSETQPVLAKLGAPVDMVLVDDLEHLDTSRYRLFLFFHTYHLTRAQRALIRQKTHRLGVTHLWFYAPGYFEGQTRSADAMRELTGLKIQAGPPDDSASLRIELTASDHPLAAALRRLGHRTIGPEGLLARRFWVSDEAAAVLGTLPRTGQAALASKQVDGITSIYAVTSLLLPAFYREVARSAGVHLYGERDDTLYVCRSYLTVNADGAGLRTFRLPQRSDVIDPFDSRVLERNVDSFQLALRDRETRIVRIAPAGGGRA